ncbi:MULTISPECIES: NAD(P)-dependent oxidoreductase [unclassified Streptomyces]|uniref:NAD-dependent epimerase/dehydratase family protein n=1 Tax=unclassified Streptomyces TaxID=2593676 RepID=UPI0022590EF5|nr:MULTISPECIES: NAD-dependent epimerase/dehydratase family protein [unclassified Streptomyces]MCX4993044.1 NAD-dependent epimerase/dehydratase family protein [Streptomyces sp. NBC_00568]MCX5001720.1 NAD-dependent epimerase/dehydratase family protein [Streptomyces sp. NBC_00638]
MTTNQSILLAGASGVLGRHITRALTEAGHRVTGLGRGPANAVQADLMDRDALLRAVDGQRYDTVVLAATALRKAPLRHRDMHATDALRTDGTAHLVEAARATGARRLVAESMVFGYGFGDHGDHVVTEADAFGPEGATPELERHIAAMRIKERLTFEAPGLEGIALRFGLFYGAGGTDALLPMLRRRQLPVADDHGRVLPWVDLADAARAVAAAVEHGRPGEAYNVTDRTPLGFAAHVRAVAGEFGLPKPMTVPLWMMKPLSYAHVMMRTTLRVSSAKAERELGWTPAHPSAYDGLAALKAAA